jgi:hypothetical protein
MQHCEKSLEMLGKNGATSTAVEVCVLWIALGLLCCCGWHSPVHYTCCSFCPAASTHSCVLLQRLQHLSTTAQCSTRLCVHHLTHVEHQNRAWPLLYCHSCTSHAVEFLAVTSQLYPWILRAIKVQATCRHSLSEDRKGPCCGKDRQDKGGNRFRKPVSQKISVKKVFLPGVRTLGLGRITFF